MVTGKKNNFECKKKFKRKNQKYEFIQKKLALCVQRVLHFGMRYLYFPHERRRIRDMRNNNTWTYTLLSL